MLSSEGRRIVVVVVASMAGATLAWVPLSSATLPIRETSSYPTWVVLIAIVCGSCPIVWTHGRRALAQLPARRQPVQEAVGYGASAAAAILVFLALGPAFFRRPPPSALPYHEVRFAVIYAAAAVAAAPGCIAMYRVGDACRRTHGRPRDLVAWRAILQSQLAGLGALVVLSTLTTGAFRNATLAVVTARPEDFPAEYVLVFGAGLTLILALVYVPPSGRLRRRAQEVVDDAFPIPNELDGDWQQQLQRRADLALALRTDESSSNWIQNALIIGGPLITTALTLLVPTH
jgi:hypothetical protein